MTATRWSDLFEASLTPARRRLWDRQRRIYRLIFRVERIVFWTRWPVLNLVFIFWTSLVHEGVIETGGALTFAFLNDGMRPTLFHAVWSVLHRNAMLYPGGAPRNRSEL